MSDMVKGDLVEVHIQFRHRETGKAYDLTSLTPSMMFRYNEEPTLTNTSLGSGGADGHAFIEFEITKSGRLQLLAKVAGALGSIEVSDSNFWVLDVVEAP